MSKSKTLLVLFINYIPFLFILSGTLVLVDTFNGDVLRTIGVGLAWLYLLPPLVCRLVMLFMSKSEAKVSFSTDDRTLYLWWITLQLQMVFSRLMFLEGLLRLIPGLYSMWLRLWGAKIGKLTLWSPITQIIDRPFLRVGDNVVFGYGSICVAHAFTKNHNGKMKLTLSSPKIESGAIVSGGCTLGPGAELAEGEMLPMFENILGFRRYENKEFVKAKYLKEGPRP